MARKVRRGGRRTQAALAGLYTSAAVGAGLARVAKTYTGLRGKKAVVGKMATYAKKYGKNLRGFKGAVKTARATSTEGYIPGFSKVVGNSKKGLSFTEKIQGVINPPQVYLFNTTQKIEAGSGRQGVAGYTVNNTLLENFFSLMAANKSDNSSNQNATLVDPNAQSNTVNHQWTSVLHTFLNSGNTTAEMEIYIYSSLQDLESTDQAISASAAWSHSESINTAAGIGADGTDKLQKKPTDYSARFYMNRYWRLLSTASVTMKPGESYKHYYRHHYNKQLAKFMFNGDTSGVTKGHCLSYIYVVRGQVVGSSLDSTVSTGDCQISCVRTTKLSHTFANSVRPRNYLVGTDLSQIVTANQTFINTDNSTALTGFYEDA